MGEQPRSAVALARRVCLELLEAVLQVALGGAVWSGSRIPLAQLGDREQTAGHQTLHHPLVELRVAEHVAEDDIDSGARRKASVEIHDVEPAATTEAVVVGETPRQVDGDR